MRGYNTHGDAERTRMLEQVGVDSIEGLYTHIPSQYMLGRDLAVPGPMSEHALMRKMRAAAALNHDADRWPCFLGGGLYDHHVPAVVDAIVNRGEFLTSYTPYQPEMSQGLLQALYEYQLCGSRLTGLPVVNSSCYDGSTALAEACWTGCLAAGREGPVLVSGAIWPRYKEVLQTYMNGRGVAVHFLESDADTGRISGASIAAAIAEFQPAVVSVQTPNAAGIVEDLPAILGACKKAGVISHVSFNPLLSALYTPPGELGADIVTGDGQPLGLHLNAGGSSLGIFATRKELRKFVPGRLVGKVTDIRGELAYALVYEDREQHVAREKATSNICSNQALNAIRAAVYIASLGNDGFIRHVQHNYQAAHEAREELLTIDGVSAAYSGPFFNEFLLRVDASAEQIAAAAARAGIYAGICRPDSADGARSELLVAVTEKRTAEDVRQLVEVLRAAVAA